MTTLTVAATQMSCTTDKKRNVRNAEALVREAASKGAQVILLQEFFETEYFCREHDDKFFDLASPVSGNDTVRTMSDLAAELDVVLPVSVYERANKSYFNSLVMIDAGGTILGTYRKSHIPQAAGYWEKRYFNPGDTGFAVWQTKYGKIGTAICWDQWFPEAARIMALEGADLLLYPSAIGSNLGCDDTESRRHWQRTMQGHSAANVIPVVASNRVGVEGSAENSLRFYGSSFVTDHLGEIVVEGDQESDMTIVSTIDTDVALRRRNNLGMFRDRRPELYGKLLTLDGS